MKKRVAKTQHDLFWSHVLKRKSTECWIWQAAKRSKMSPYGAFGRPVRLAHRVAWELANGPIPTGFLVLHRCDVGLCVNPRHLFLGTQADNVHDSRKKGRFKDCRGEANGFARLTSQTVIAVRDAHARFGMTQVEAGRRFGLSQSQAQRIISRTTWSHL